MTVNTPLRIAPDAHCVELSSVAEAFERTEVTEVVVGREETSGDDYNCDDNCSLRRALVTSC